MNYNEWCRNQDKKIWKKLIKAEEENRAAYLTLQQVKRVLHHMPVPIVDDDEE